MESERQRRPRLWLGYGLILAVILFGVTAVVQCLQHVAIARLAATQAQAIGALNRANGSAVQRIVGLERQARQRDEALSVQRQDIERQAAAIQRLAELRREDRVAILALHDALAANHVKDERLLRRLVQLEESNAAARAAIRAADASAKP